MISETPNFNNPVLETERVILRKITLNDLGDIYNYCSDKEVSKFTTWYPHSTIEDSLGFVKHIICLYEENKLAPWGIEDKETKTIIGTVGFVYLDEKQSRAELAYALSREYWNKGVMSEIVRKVIQYGFEVMKLVRIEARCLLLNTGSFRVMEKCGMELEGILRKHVFVKGMFQDLKLYSIINEENCRMIQEGHAIR
ncbi:alanine acetyltransferase [Paenibacillus baekrokdamisoli]|uniref:Alanine acetyltransferase n=1 Tax=Paenibacillus baekrokdamisoli TaxID=1712516 RepID=A0A3G9J748_9BACL|nr:GNAT family N-acetyltransferase [Paenibacillus baekrokdamisoli]MBB3071873.1 ribosomal-protein-alanine N-acetyltransferase [Paenibacillus baekrokdamisoli]BBH24145.1 alanine acetyltransferase [Paenibacillus baekrokdamisoli]